MKLKKKLKNVEDTKKILCLNGQKVGFTKTLRNQNFKAQ